MFNFHKPPQKQSLSSKLIKTFNYPSCSKHTHSYKIMQKLFEYPRKYPVVRGMASYGLVWPVCSITQEYLAHGTTLRNADLARAARYGFFGCFAMAPAWHIWMKLSGKLFIQKNLSSAIKRAIFEQITYSPVALAFFFFGMSACEKKSFPACANEVKEKFWPTYSIGALFWPTAQTLNFYYVPEKNRVLCVTLASCVWTTFMAYMKEKEPKKERYDSSQDMGTPLMGNVNTAGMLKNFMNPIDMDKKSSSDGNFDNNFKFQLLDSDFSTENIIFESGEYMESTDGSKDSDDLQLVNIPEAYELVESTIKERYESSQDMQDEYDMHLMENVNAAGMLKKSININSTFCSSGFFENNLRFKTMDSDFSTENIIFESGEYMESTDDSKDSDGLQLVPEQKPKTHEFVESTFKERYESSQDMQDVYDMPLIGNLNTDGMLKKLIDMGSSSGFFDNNFRFKTIDSDFSTENIIFESGEYMEPTDDSKDSDDLQLVPEQLSETLEFVESTCKEIFESSQDMQDVYDTPLIGNLNTDGMLKKLTDMDSSSGFIDNNSRFKTIDSDFSTENIIFESGEYMEPTDNSKDSDDLQLVPEQLSETLEFVESTCKEIYESSQDMQDVYDTPLIGNLNTDGMLKKLTDMDSSSGCFDNNSRFKTIDSDFSTENIIFESGEYTEPTDDSKDFDDLQLVPEQLSETLEFVKSTDDDSKEFCNLQLIPEQIPESHEVVVLTEEIVGTTGNAKITTEDLRIISDVTEINIELPSEDGKDKRDAPGPSGDFKSNENEFAGYIKNDFTKSNNNNVDIFQDAVNQEHKQENEEPNENNEESSTDNLVTEENSIETPSVVIIPVTEFIATMTGVIVEPIEIQEKMFKKPKIEEADNASVNPENKDLQTNEKDNSGKPIEYKELYTRMGGMG